MNSTNNNKTIRVPRYFKPWPHHVENWHRQQSGDYTYYVKLWSRQTGKTTYDIQYALKKSWDIPGIQQVYIGLDNVWVRDNIYKKTNDSRTFWSDYPDEYIEPKDTLREVIMHNRGRHPETEDVVESRIKFIGFLNDQALIGSSHDRFHIEEMSLYPRNAFMYLEPIWENKLALGKPLEVSCNFTPRGIKNVAFDMLKSWTGKDSHEEFAGAHITPLGTCYVDVRPVDTITVPMPDGKVRPLYTDERLEDLRQRYIREYGNDNLFRQEFFCDFLAVNAGLVFPATEIIIKEKRVRTYNINTAYPVYVSFDIGGRNERNDPTTAVIYQWYHGSMYVYDYYEARGVNIVEAISEIASRGYWKYVRYGFLPWDAEQGASLKSVAEEAREAFPNQEWVVLERESVARGIQYVREELPNMIINDSQNCERLVECLLNYEYKRSDLLNDWGKVLHNEFSHGADALRYGAAALRQSESWGLLNNAPSKKQNWDYKYPETWTGPARGPKTEKEKEHDFWE